MKLNWNFLGGGGDAKQKTFCGGSMDIFCKCTIHYCNRHVKQLYNIGKQNSVVLCSGLVKVFNVSVPITPWGGGWGGTPYTVMDRMGSLHPKGVLFSGWRSEIKAIGISRAKV